MNTSGTNERIASQLALAADILEYHGAGKYRVGAYRRAAMAVRSMPEDVGELIQREGIAGLITLPGIGRVIGDAVGEMVRTGKWSQLERLRGTLNPVALFVRVPGMGPRLAQRIVDELHIESLEELEDAAHDGRLDKLPGFGARRLSVLRLGLAEMLGRPRIQRMPSTVQPDVGLLLAIDRDYREKAARGELRLIAPRRFNPEQKAWLPIYHSEKGEWHFTALFSNTAQAHRLERTHDWVIVVFSRDADGEGQGTVVTETQGTLRGRRVVRGREIECDRHYRAIA